MRTIRSIFNKDDIFKRFLFRVFVILMLSGFTTADFSGRPVREQNSETGSKGDPLLSTNSTGRVSKDREAGMETKVENRVKRGETLAQILTGQGVDFPIVLRLFSAVRDLHDLKLIHAGHWYGLTVRNGDLSEFWYEIDLNRHLKVTRNDTGHFSGEIHRIPYEIKKEIVQGKIGDSLFRAVLQVGEKPELADRLASLFEYDVDFNRDIRAGDRFEVLVEKKYLNHDFISYGDLLAAKLVNAKKKIHLIRYTDPAGKTAYYHPDGRAAKKMFLRCPLPFLRLTSGYGLRLHPVLGFSAKHNGVDLSAPRGTRIRSTAGGVVIRSGSDRFRGKYLMIRHPNDYISHYYHLDRIQTGLKAGIPVEQAQVIGTVGSSGRTTGCHLHYGLMKNGRFINPMTLESPSLDPLSPIYLDAFKRYSAAVFFLMSNHRFFSVPGRIQDMILGTVGQPLVQAGEPFIH